jgi:hypothetical protein
VCVIRIYRKPKQMINRSYYILSSFTIVVPRIRPVRRAAIRPTYKNIKIEFILTKIEILYLATRWCITTDCRWFTNVLMITSTKWMVNGLEKNKYYQIKKSKETLTFMQTPRTRGHDFRFALYL